jgi:hypothetical protein
MDLRIKVYSLASENATPVFTCKVDVLGTEQYDARKVRLEELGVVEWPFDFWDVEAIFQTKNQLDGMIIIDLVVYLIPSLFAVVGSRKRY